MFDNHHIPSDEGDEKNLKSAGDQYKHYFQHVQDYAIFMLSSDGLIMTWNHGAAEILGYTASEVIGKSFALCYTQEDQTSSKLTYELSQALVRGSYSTEAERVKKDGSTICADVTISVIYDANENFAGFSTIIKDLSSAKEAEKKLKESEERYRLLVEGVKDYAIFMLDPEGYIISWNEGAKRFKGYEEHEIIGRHFSVFYPKDKIEMDFPAYELEQAKLLGKFEDEGWRLRKDGSTFYANVVITAIFSRQGKHIGFSKITRDLTERKAAEERLRLSEERYRLLIEGVKDYAIFMLDPLGYVISWNEGARKLKRYNADEIIGKHFSTFYPEEQKKRNYPEYELTEAKKLGRFEDEGWRIRKDGTSFYANVIITAIFNELGELKGFSKITRDLTERKLAEEKLGNLNAALEKRVSERTDELSKTVKELKMINADLDNFIYTASHDLKAPVSNIEGLIRTLTEELIDNNYYTEDIRMLMGMIETSVRRFQSTIKDLTSVNESQKSGLDDLMSIDLPALVQDVKGSIEHLVVESGAEIETHIEGFESFQFSRIHIRSIIYNFLTNSIKYRSQERPLKILFQAYKENNDYVISVTDNGIGIQKENIDKIFKLFQRLQTHIEGSGIGLYIVKKIVDNAGGKIEVSSIYGEGTTFRIYLQSKSQA